MGTAIKHPGPDLVKPSFVIFRLNQIWHRMLLIAVPIWQQWASKG